MTSKKTRGVPRMTTRRRLTPTTICVHNKPSSRCLTFNNEISTKAHKMGLRYLDVHTSSDGRLYMILTTVETLLNPPRLTYNTRSTSITACVSSIDLTTQICNHFGKGDGDYYIRITDNTLPSDKYNICVVLEEVLDSQPIDVYKTRKCSKCGRVLPESQYYRKGDTLQSWCIDCCKEHGRLRNGTTGEYRTNPTITEATDQELYNELKRRGFEGELIRKQVLK